MAPTSPCTCLPACLTRSYSGVGTLQARAKEERLVRARGPAPPARTCILHALLPPPFLPPPHQLTRRGVREITAERRKQDNEERAAAEAAGPEALAEWMMTQARSQEWGGRMGEEALAEWMMTQARSQEWGGEDGGGGAR